MNNGSLELENAVLELAWSEGPLHKRLSKARVKMSSIGVSTGQVIPEPIASKLEEMRRELAQKGTDEEAFSQMNHHQRRDWVRRIVELYRESLTALR
jgi:hypothetical protein